MEEVKFAFSIAKAWTQHPVSLRRFPSCIILFSTK